MGFKLKKTLFKKDDYALTGVTLIIVPFIISILLTVVFLPMDSSKANQIGITIIDLPNDYENMTEIERENYMIEQHGFWTWSFSYVTKGDMCVVFQDGYYMLANDWTDYLDGNLNPDGMDTDWGAMFMSMVSIDPPALNQLGVYGVVFRLILYACVCIGFVDLIWLG